MTRPDYAGTAQIPPLNELTLTTSLAEIDAEIQALQQQKENWVALPLSERITIVEKLLKDFAAITPRWVDACMQAKGITTTGPFAGDEWIAGAWTILSYLQQLHKVLLDIARTGHPGLPGPVTTHSDGQVVARVFPFNAYDRIFFPGISAEVWMQPGITSQTLPQHQATAYQGTQQPGRVALVLGAGNVSSIGPLDILYKLFTENQVVLYKPNPVNAYLGPLLQEAFQELTSKDYMKIVYGGAEEGTYLCAHNGIDEIHVTGSDKTFEAIVFGTGTEGSARKQAQQPLIRKKVSGELGNVSPLIIVPGPWSNKDIAYQATHIASSLANNAGYNCNATRVIIQHAEWQQRRQLLQQINQVFSHLPARKAFYPGAQQRYHDFITQHPDAEQFGAGEAQNLPWAVIADVDPEQVDDICFKTEAFCSLFAETALSAQSVTDYIARAVTFANEHLWGTLSATLLVHPTSLKDPTIAAAVEQAVADLRYGTIGLNYWAGTGFTFGVTTWGAFPGHTIDDIQSGNGIVHNSLMFSEPQKSVIRAPFRSPLTPPWFVDQSKIAAKLFPKLTNFAAAPAPGKLPGIIWSALGR